MTPAERRAERMAADLADVSFCAGFDVSGTFLTTVGDRPAVTATVHHGHDQAALLWLVLEPFRVVMWDRLWVDPRFQRRGLGRAVMRRMIALLAAAGERELRLTASHDGRYAWAALYTPVEPLDAIVTAGAVTRAAQGVDPGVAERFRDDLRTGAVATLAQVARWGRGDDVATVTDRAGTVSRAAFGKAVLLQAEDWDGYADLRAANDDETRNR